MGKIAFLAVAVMLMALSAPTHAQQPTKVPRIGLVTGSGDPGAWPIEADLAIKNRLPSMYEASSFVEVGGLVSYTSSRAESGRCAAYYVDRILKGAKPADLPVEGPTKFELVINLKTAEQLGLTIPPSVLYQADRVIQ